MNRKQRRAAEHQARKAARKASFPVNDIPEPNEAPFPSLAAISPARLAANRENAQLSSGPVTPEGKAISSQNHTTHGLARHNGAFKLLATEGPHGFEALKTALVTEHNPQTETESILVQTMAESRWLSLRAQSLQHACFDPETGAVADTKLFSLYLRYQSTHTRLFHKAFGDLLKLRKERLAAQLGSEAQRIKTEKHELKKDDHFWHVMRKDAEACHQVSLNSQEYMKGLREHGLGFKAQYESDLARHGLQQSELSVAELKPAA